MDKMKFETPDIIAENIAKLAELFPGVVVEGKVNVDLLRSYVGEEIFGDEAYEFTWVGKRAAIAEAGRPIRKTLRPCVEESKDWDTTENLYIEGDNLDVLKLLQESYLGKVKMIYIDPPYNTGNDFIYRDDFVLDKDDYDEEAGVYDEDGDRLFRNTETNGRFHSDWCSMMYPRLVLARNMLREDGVIFISIDDNELVRLRKICDEIFGACNFIAQLIWKSKSGGANDSRFFAVDHEYLICYTKNANIFNLFIDIEATVTTSYNRQDENGRYSLDRLDKQSIRYSQSLDFEIKDRDGNSYFPKHRDPSRPNATWRWGKSTVTERFDELVFKNGNIYTKNYEKKGAIARSLLLEDRFGRTRTGKTDLLELLNVEIFQNPKPHKLVRYLSMITTNSKDIILDFFSGSATTAHAVMQLNAEDGGRRKFIMVQLPETCAEGTEAAKAGYKNICEIGKERIRRAGAKIIAETTKRNGTVTNDGSDVGATPCGCPDIVQHCIKGEHIGSPLQSHESSLFDAIGQPQGVAPTGTVTQNTVDTGFRVLKLDDTNMTDVYYAAGDYTQDMLSLFENNIKPDRTDMDLLFGCLLDWGLPLSMPHTHEIIDGATVHNYNNGDLIACFADKISDTVVKEIANRRPLRAVFRDSSFTGSPEKINVAEIFKLLAPNTTVRVI